SSQSSAAIGSGAHDAIVAPSQLGDSCKFYRRSNGSECRHERSCFDCLNVALLNGQVCELDKYGDCTGHSNSSGQPRADVFLSSTHRYCNKTDPACQMCYRQNSSSSGSGNEWRYQVCLGADGCVCLARCARTRESFCTSTSTSDDSIPPVAWMMGTAILLALSAGLYLFAQRNRRRRRRQATRCPPASPKVQLLELTGWRAMRRQLIDHEHSTLGLTRPTAMPSNPPDDVAPSVLVEYGPRTHPLEQRDLTIVES
ncbi:TPA: hypothetical protein N0F65_008925, partial [Lagenidium giganteum]